MRRFWSGRWRATRRSKRGRLSVATSRQQSQLHALHGPELNHGGEWELHQTSDRPRARGDEEAIGGCLAQNGRIDKSGWRVLGLV